MDIPIYGIFGEPDRQANTVHCEPISARAGLHHWQIVPHRHDRLLQLIVIDSGAAQARVDAQECRITDGQFLFIPAQTVHSFRFQPGTRGLVLSFPTALLAAFGAGQAEIARHLEQPLSGPIWQSLRPAVRQLSATCAQDKPLSQHAATGLGLFVLAELADHASQTLNSGQIARRGAILSAFDAQIQADLLSQNAAQCGAAQHAARLGVSTGHLSRLCRAQSGRGAAAYLESRIMEEACRLLAFTTLGIAQIGYRLGYSDPSYFSRRFVRYSGQSPSHYRRTCFQTDEDAPAKAVG